MAWSCSPSSAYACAKAIHAGPKRASSRTALPKKRRASSQRRWVKYQSPTAYQATGDSGARSTYSWARRKRREWSVGRWYMQPRWRGRVGVWPRWVERMEEVTE
jgi:hypothetical protein